MSNYLENLIPNVISTLSAIVAVYFSFQSAKSAKESKITTVRFKQDELAENLSPVFWSTLRKAYSGFRKERPQLPENIDQLILSAGGPYDLSEHTDPISYDIKKAPPEQLELWEFVKAIYPLETSGNLEELKSKSIIPFEEADGFFQARSKMCGFWDTAIHELGVKTTLKIYAGQSLLLFMLAYLDIVHRKWTREANRGKPYLYKLVTKLS